MEVTRGKTPLKNGSIYLSIHLSIYLPLAGFKNKNLVILLQSRKTGLFSKNLVFPHGWVLKGFVIVYATKCIVFSQFIWNQYVHHSDTRYEFWIHHIVLSPAAENPDIAKAHFDLPARDSGGICWIG